MDLEPGSFYLGGVVDPDSGERTEPLVYHSDDLVTHGVIVGMTGSGKTGLGVVLLEEALRSKVPCLVIDPKGDMGNLRLIFPDFAPADFAPWVDPAEAERSGQTADELAVDIAGSWREGLASWQIGPDRLRDARDGSEITIYTPGSNAGVPIDILGSLAAPGLSWESHAEEMRDEIEGYVSSLLVLAGIESDPVSGPDHILLATIIEAEWKAGRDLDLARLVGSVIDPPFRKLGVFELDTFYPKKDRTELAMRLNGLLASPSFASWMEGEPLDIGALLTGGDRTKAAVIYLAHLADSERQFVVTMILARLVTWMRRQSGTGQLRALVYMDEVFGFAPPVAEPPAKKQILTILKQARAFGVGMVLSTQNPVDLDYKAMSNAGTWMVGRLQTENDKARILEGLSDAGGATDVAAVNTLISNLEQRQFVLRQTGSAKPTVFASRWAMSYLAGPLDRTRVARLTDRRPAASDIPEPEVPDLAPTPAQADDESVPVAPHIDAVVAHLDPAAVWSDKVGAVAQGGRWRAVGVATVHLRYDDRSAEVDHREDYEAVIDPLEERFDPESVVVVDHDPRDFLSGPPPEGVFLLPEPAVKTAAFWKSLATDLADHLARQQRLTVWKNESLKIYSRVGESEEQFRTRCETAAEEAADADVAELKHKYKAKIERVRAQIVRADRRVAELEVDVSSRKQQEVVSGVGDLLGSLLGGKSRSGALRRASSRRSQTARTGADLETAAGKLAEEQQELADLEDELANDLTEIVDGWDAKAAVTVAVEIPLERSDVDVAEVKLVWVPTA